MQKPYWTGPLASIYPGEYSELAKRSDRCCRWHMTIAGRTPLMRSLLAAIMLTLTSLPTSASDIRVLAAGSLRDVLTSVFVDYARQHGVEFIPVWGPSGALRERIQRGEAFDIFASAALPHAQTLTDAGLSGPSSLFARNTLCVVTGDDRQLDAAGLAATMLDPAIRIGTSTPVADPAGDYTWELFRKIDAQRPGAFDLLSKKAKQLFGGPTTATPIDGRHRLVAALADHEIDLFVYYCSGVKSLVSGSPGLISIALPPELSVGAEYGLTVSRQAAPEAKAFAAYLLSPQGQDRLKAYGFIPAKTSD